MKSIFHSRLLHTICAAAVCIIWAREASAQAPSPASVREFRTLTVETVYPFAVTPYSRPNAITPNFLISLRTIPEDTVVQLFSSMIKGDWDWNSSLWTRESLALMREKDSIRGLAPQHWLGVWARRRLWTYELVSRIEYGKYVLIAYAAYDETKKSVESDTLVLTKVEEQWFLTQELLDDPVVDNWDAPNRRVRRAPNSLIIGAPQAQATSEIMKQPSRLTTPK